MHAIPPFPATVYIEGDLFIIKLVFVFQIFPHGIPPPHGSVDSVFGYRSCLSIDMRDDQHMKLPIHQRIHHRPDFPIESLHLY